MRARIHAVLMSCLILASTACDDPAGVIQDNVEIIAAHDALTVRNSRPATIYYFAIDRELAAVVDWLPCTNPGTCPSIASGEAKRVPYSEIEGNARSGEVLVFWWHLIEKNSGWTHEQMHSIVVRVGQ